MATRDIGTHLESVQLMFEVISGNSTHFSAAFDSSDFDPGVVIYFAVINRLDGTYSFTVEEKLDDGSWVQVGPEKVSGSGPNSFVITSSVAPGGVIPKIGLFSTKKELRVKLVASSIALGANVEVFVVASSENSPI